MGRTHKTVTRPMTYAASKGAAGVYVAPAAGGAVSLIGASYDSVSKAMSGVSAFGVSGLFFKDDGTRLIMNGLANMMDFVITAWDITSVGAAANTKSTGGLASGLFMKADGNKAYFDLSDQIQQYSTAAWALSTWTNDSAPTTGTVAGSVDAWITADGSKIYRCGTDVKRFTLSTPHDLTSDGSPATLITGTDLYTAVQVRSDGEKIFLVNQTQSRIEQYGFTDGAFGSTLTALEASLDVSTECTPYAMFIAESENKMFVGGGAPTHTIFRYSV